MSRVIRKGSKQFLNQFCQRPVLTTLYAGRAVVFNGAMQDKPMFNVRQFAAAARIAVPEARLPALAAGLAATLDSMERLLALGYGDTEPASRFWPPSL